MQTINFKYKGIDYELGFSRSTVIKAEKQGFVVSDLQSKPLSAMQELFNASFLLNHKKTKPELKAEMWEKMADTSGLVEALVDLYLANVNAIMDGNTDEKNAIEWKVNS